MAELNPNGDVVETGALAQPSSVEGATAQQESDSYAPDELKGLITDSLREHWAGIDRVVTKDRERVIALEGAVTALLGESKRTAALIERIAQGSMTEEDWNRIQYEEQKQRADRAEAALVEKAKPQETSPADPSALLKFELERYHIPEIRRHAQRRGLNLDEATAQAAGLINARGEWQIQRGREGVDPNDPYGWEPFIADATQRLDVHADKIGLVKEPGVEIDDTRAGGVAGGDAKAYQVWLEGKGPRPPSAVIDAITRPYLSRTT